jgi:hypothetical protein
LCERGLGTATTLAQGTCDFGRARQTLTSPSHTQRETTRRPPFDDQPGGHLPAILSERDGAEQGPRERSGLNGKTQREDRLVTSSPISCPVRLNFFELSCHDVKLEPTKHSEDRAPSPLRCDEHRASRVDVETHHHRCGEFATLFTSLSDAGISVDRACGAECEFGKGSHRMRGSTKVPASHVGTDI